jgi:hypothetical protein
MMKAGMLQTGLFHRARPRGLKTALTLTALAAAVAWIVALLRWGQLQRIKDGFQVRLAGFEWNDYWNPSLFLAALSGLVFLAVAPGWWPARLTPRHKAVKVVLLSMALFVVAEIALARLLRVFLPDPFYLQILAVVCLGLAFYLLRGVGGRDALSRLGEWLRAGRMRGLGGALFVLGCLASVVGWQWYFGGYDLMVDSISQNAQARLLLLGHFTLDIPQRLRDVINFPSAMPTVPSYSQFPPGHLVLMIPLIAAGLPVQGINILAAGGIVALTAALARRLGGRVAGLTAGALLAFSPFFIALVGTAMNHATACLALLAAAWCFLPVGPAPTRAQAMARGVLGGLMLGWAATIRPLTALAHGVVWCGVWGVLLLEAWRRGRWGRPQSFRADRSPKDVLARVVLAGLALLPPLLFFLFYNSRTTGHPLKMPYAISNPELHRLGFSAGGPYSFTPRDALENFAADLYSLNFLLLGWPIGSWLLIVPWWLRTRLSRGERVLLALAAMQTLLYGLYRYHHLVLGPRFLFEAFPLVAILLALGVAPLLRRGGQWAGALAATMLFLSLWGPALGHDRFWLAFEDGALRHERLAAFMRGLPPLRRPTVVVFDAEFIDMCGRYFPHDPGRPDLWFVERKDETRARALPELAGCEWVRLNLSSRR